MLPVALGVAKDNALRVKDLVHLPLGDKTI